jgi:hypothetical protein
VFVIWSTKGSLICIELKLLPLVIAYIVPLNTPTTPQTDDMKTMLPDPDCFKRGCATWHKWYADSRLVAIKNEYSSAENSVVGFLMFVPTLFTYKVSRSNHRGHINRHEN